MATELQLHLIQLLREIDATCDELGLPYALFGDSAAWASARSTFIGGCCELHIMMRAKDIATLKQAIGEMGLAQRAFEDLSTNSKLAYNEVRYVDTGTTLIDKDDYVRYDALGGAVIIHPLYAQMPSQMLRSIARGVVRLNGAEGYMRFKLGKKEAFAMSAGRAVMGAMGNAVLTDRLYGLVKRDKGFTDGGSCFYQGQGGVFRKMDSRYLFDTKRIPFECVEVPVPADTAAYLRDHFGTEWNPETAERPKTANRIAVLCDASTPYEETIAYLAEDGFDIRAIQEKHFDFFTWYNEEFQYWKSAVDADYAHALMSRDRIDLFVKLESEMGSLRDARDAGNLAELEELLDGYLKKTRKYLKKGLGFYLNDELFQMASLVWECQGKPSYARKVYELVPEAYKHEDIAEFLAAYR